MRRYFALALVVTVFASMGAQYRTTNFHVHAADPQVAQLIGQWAEHYRKEKAMLWLGQEMPNWPQPCPLHVEVNMQGPSGATSFHFGQGQVLSMKMEIQGPLERLVRSVLPPGARWAIESQRTLYASAPNVRPKQVDAHAVEGEYFTIKKYDLTSGRVISPEEYELGVPVAVIGDEVAKYFFPNLNPLGRELHIGGIPYSVIGVIEHQGTLFGLSLDKLVVAPFGSAMHRLTNPLNDIGGLLVQDRDWDVEDRLGMDIVCGSASETLWGDLLFAWRVCKHVTSNAIVLARDLQTLGIGAGQMSRVDSVRIALEKAREHGHGLADAVLASDAFFPFADGPELALRAGVSAFIQPGGSKRDEEVIAAVEQAGATMVFTGRRHFRH